MKFTFSNFSQNNIESQLMCNIEIHSNRISTFSQAGAHRCPGIQLPLSAPMPLVLRTVGYNTGGAHCRYIRNQVCSFANREAESETAKQHAESLLPLVLRTVRYMQVAHNLNQVRPVFHNPPRPQAERSRARRAPFEMKPERIRARRKRKSPAPKCRTL